MNAIRAVRWVPALAAAAVVLAVSGSVGSQQPSSPAPREVEKLPVLQAERPDFVEPLPEAPAEVVRNGFVSVQVNVDPEGRNIPGDAANEPSIAVDPTAPNRLVVGWRQFDSIGSNFREAGYGYSRDGGRSWTFPGVLEEGVFRSDPVLDCDAAGRVHYLSLAVANDTYLTDFFTSGDGGGSWSEPVPSYGGDKEWFTIDRNRPAASGGIYEVWSAEENLWGYRVVTRSNDGGATFDYPIRVYPVPTWGSLAIGPEGELYIVGNDTLDLDRIVLQRSLDAFEPDVWMPTFESFDVPLGGSQANGRGLDPEPRGHDRPGVDRSRPQRDRTARHALRRVLCGSAEHRPGGRPLRPLHGPR